jgi:diguanylate cyclase (GGDEF)-like protein
MKNVIEHHDLLFSTLSEITSLIAAGHDRSIIIEKLLECSLVVLDAERVHLLQMESDRIVKHTRTQGDDGPVQVSVTPLGEDSALRSWLVKEGQSGTGVPGGVPRGQELAFDLPAITQGLLSDDSSRVIISAPLVAKRSMFGLLVAIHRDDGGMYSADDVKLLTILANHAAIAVENALLYQQLEREAITDGLTSAFNYRFLMSSLDTEIKRARRFRQTFSFVMLDVDNLKTFNDTHGHLSGSEALKRVAAIIRGNCREIDLVSKYGGDEFGIMLPQTRLDGAEHVTKRVIDAVRSHRFDGKRTGLITCSAGISSFPRDGQSAEEIIGAADKSLYQAKRSGKNQVVTTEGLIEELAP